MPTYDLLHKPTGEITEKKMTIAELGVFLQENPDFEVAILQAPNLGDPVALGVKQVPADFQKGVIDSIKRRNPGRTHFGQKQIKETKFKVEGKKEY